jgi:hypothetical protein
MPIATTSSAPLKSAFHSNHLKLSILPTRNSFALLARDSAAERNSWWHTNGREGVDAYGLGSGSNRSSECHSSQEDETKDGLGLYVGYLRFRSRRLREEYLRAENSRFLQR